MIVRRTWQFRQIDAKRAPVKPLKIYIVRAEFDSDRSTPLTERDRAKEYLAAKLGVPVRQIEFLSGTNGWSELVRI